MADQITNVTPSSLAFFAGIVDGEPAMWPLLSVQIGIIQRSPKAFQEKIYAETAAKYLPKLLEVYKTSGEFFHPSIRLINVFSHTPQFIRFLRTSSEASQLHLYFSHIIASNISEIDQEWSPTDIGEICQFQSTLWAFLGVQGGVEEEEDKKVLKMYYRKWMRRYPGTHCEKTAERCWEQITEDRTMKIMAQGLKTMMEKPLVQCGASDCERESKPDGKPLLQCARCKCAVYCSPEHQKSAWLGHKAICFAPTF